MSEQTDAAEVEDALEAGHRAHVAAVLRVEIDRALGDAWDEGYHVGVAHAQMPAGATFKPNPYRPTLAADEGDVR